MRAARRACRNSETVLKPIVAEKISDLLIANGFTEESARAIESAAKASSWPIDTLPPGSVALAVGALDSAGDYRVKQITIFESGEYVGTVARRTTADTTRGRAGHSAGADRRIGRPAEVGARFNVADGVYSAGLRNGVPEDIIREAIQLVSRLTDLKSPLQADQSVRILYERDFRDKAKSAGRVVYVGLHGGALNSTAMPSRTATAVFAASIQGRQGVESAEARRRPGRVESLGSSGATSVGGILAPIKGAPVTSLFGMRFHPILHILRLHAGIDFGAPIGSPVRAAADGKIEIAGPVSGFGNHVRIQHAGFETSYSHLSEIPESIKPGVEVKEGDIIALSGNTGLSTGPHLHFEYLSQSGGGRPASASGHGGSGVGAPKKARPRPSRPGSRPAAGSSGATAVEVARLPGDQGLYRRRDRGPDRNDAASLALATLQGVFAAVAVDDDDRDIVARAALERQLEKVCRKPPADRPAPAPSAISSSLDMRRPARRCTSRNRSPAWTAPSTISSSA